MEYKTDFIEREVQKIILFLRNVIAKITKSTDPNTVLQSFNEELKKKLDFSFNEILELSDDDLKKEINEINLLVLEDLLKVFYETSKKESSSFKLNNLKRVSLILLDIIEQKSSIYSLERSNIKNYFKTNFFL